MNTYGLIILKNSNVYILFLILVKINAIILAHEIGHIFGIGHDTIQCKQNKNTIMASPLVLKHINVSKSIMIIDPAWSTCSLRDFFFYDFKKNANPLELPRMTSWSE